MSNVSARVFTQSDSNLEETTTSCTTPANVFSEDYTEGTPVANASSDYDLEDDESSDQSCRVYVANTDGDQVLIGCTVYCENYTMPYDQWRECVNITKETAFTMQNETRYICPMGFCTRGYCYKTGMKLPCWVSF
ncbi:uncharacterized protein LOC144119943 [Amblyomma americanum]